MNRPVTRSLLLTGSCIAFFVLAAAHAAGQEPPATQIEGSVDGQPQTWIVQQEGRHSSAVFTTPSPGVEHVFIDAYTNERHAREGSLSVEFVVSQEGIRSIVINYFPFPRPHPRFTLREDYGSGELTIDRFESGANKARVSGSFAGTLFYHQSPRTEPIPHRTRDLEFAFDLELQRE